MGGLAVRCAQSRGEWPGSRRTFLEGRVEGARVEAEREELGGAREADGGTRRAAAVEGGGRRVEERVGGTRRVDAGVGGGGMRALSSFRFAFGFSRGGGGILALSGGGGGGDMSGRDEGSAFVSAVA